MASERRFDRDSRGQYAARWIAALTALTLPRSWLGLVDQRGASVPTSQSRCGHLVPIAGRRLEAGGSHYGLIVTSDRTLARGRGAIGALARGLDGLLTSLPADDALADQTRWLGPVE